MVPYSMDKSKRAHLTRTFRRTVPSTESEIHKIYETEGNTL